MFTPHKLTYMEKNRDFNLLTAG